MDALPFFIFQLDWRPVRPWVNIVKLFSLSLMLSGAVFTTLYCLCS